MLIELQDISKYYGSGQNCVKALDHINISFREYEMTAVIGKSGCGKSTLINILAGLATPTSGRYYFNGNLIDFSKQNQLSKFRYENIGIIVQNFALINNMTAYQNIALPVRKRFVKRKLVDSIEAIANRLGIYEKLDSFPYQLSGGECQRVAIARALICEPKLILADEPTGALDADNAGNVISILKDITEATVIIATHDMEIAAQCQRTITLSYGKIK